MPVDERNPGPPQDTRITADTHQGTRSSADPFDYGALTFADPVMEAMNAIKGGNARMRTVLERLYGADLFGGGGSIDLARLQNLAGRASGAGMGTPAQFLNRIIRFMQDGTLPRDGGGGGGGGGVAGGVDPYAGGGGGGGAGGGGGGGGGGAGGSGMAGVGADIFGPYKARLLQMLENPGMPPEILEDARRQLYAVNKQGLRDQLLRRANQGSARSLFDSGLTQQGFAGLESAALDQLAGALSNLDLQNAQMANQALGIAFGGVNNISQANLTDKGLNIERMLGLKNIDLGHAQLGVERMLGLRDLALRRQLGMGDLGLRRDQLAMDRAMQDFLMNLQLQQGFYGV